MTTTSPLDFYNFYIHYLLHTPIIMKKYILLFLVALTVQTTMAQKALFDKYESSKGVETVFISKAMLSFAGSIGGIDKDIARVANKLDEVRILSCEKPAKARTIVSEARAIYSKGYTELMRLNDDGEKVTIYQKPVGKKYEYVLLSVERDEVDIINLVGTLTLEDLKRIAD